MADPGVSDARMIARKIIQRIVADPAFADELRSNPYETVRAAGVPEWAVNEFVVHDLGIEPDVAGYAMADCALSSFLWIDEDGIQSN